MKVGEMRLQEITEIGMENHVVCIVFCCCFFWSHL